ncbi:hypothetical protein H0E87_013680 [Populus deltoides]|uniref:Bifunctional inhibitor/plant lipid transfer protein/seed storage helical domain-containing protein n=1 Tax=Populus deltoides TaxID=3696 RepID=A0A8T2YP80_POPDE|nr:hypothetical protein H0E87_013680 [Populus deltoides]
MAKFAVANLLILLLSLGALLTSIACPSCPSPPHPKPPVKPPKVKPPFHPKPPIVKPPKPPVTPKPPVVKPPKPEIPCPPPPVIPTPPIVKPPPTPPKQETCPIDTLKLGACVDVLGGLIHIGIGSSAKDECCPLLEGLVDLDAAVCLCTVIKAKLLNINLILPIALELLVDCGKTPPEGFKCPS